MIRRPRIVYSLPFIRNHDFARNSIKGFVFKAFRVLSSRLHGRLKKETVNLSLKNGILRLDVISANQSDDSAEAFSLNTATRFLSGEREKQGGHEMPTP